MTFIFPHRKFLLGAFFAICAVGSARVDAVAVDSTESTRGLENSGTSVITEAGHISAESADASTMPKVQQDLASFKELSQLKLDSAKEILQKDIQGLQLRLEAQDRIIASQSGYVDKGLGLLNTVLTILGLVLALAGIGGYFSVRGKAREEARETARKWLEENASDLNAGIEAVRNRLHELESQARQQIDSHVQIVERGAEEAKKQIQISINQASKVNDSVPLEAASALSKAAKAARKKSEKFMSFDDWDNMAFDAFGAGDIERASELWRVAVAHPNAHAANVAATLFNIGVALDLTGKGDEAINIWMEVVERFDDDSSIALRLEVAKSRVNLGAVLTDSSAAWDQYERVIGKEGGSQVKDLQIQVARAQNGLGFLLVCKAKKEWASEQERLDNLYAAKEYFAKADSVEPDEYIYLANQAYCSHLLGENEQFIKDTLKRALVLGGQKAYDAIAGDLAIEPVPEKDQEFQALLEVEWARKRTDSKLVSAA